jgi:hypothetical protein
MCIKSWDNIVDEDLAIEAEDSDDSFIDGEDFNEDEIIELDDLPISPITQRLRVIQHNSNEYKDL